MFSFEQQAQEAKNFPPEEYPSFAQETVQEIFEKFQTNKATEPNPATTMPPEKDDSFVARPHTNVPAPKHTNIPKCIELEIIDVLHQPSLPPLDISTPLTTNLSLYQ